MNLQIRRVGIKEITEDAFLKNHFEPEVPLILTDVTQSLGRSTEDLRALLGKILGDSGTRTNKTWFQASSAGFQAEIGIPPLVSAALDGSRSYLRDQNLRIWLNRRGHETPFHADVNGLFVFNFQVSGKKRWQLVHPDARMEKYPLTQVAVRKYNRAEPPTLGHPQLEFDLHEGELLFVPPYWYHRVISLDELNLNVNWVGTKKQGRPNRLMARESEIMKGLYPLSQFALVRKVVDLLVGSKEPNYFAHYAGNGGPGLIESRIRHVPISRALRRLGQEFLGFPRLAFEWRTIASYQLDPRKVLRTATFPETKENKT